MHEKPIFRTSMEVDLVKSSARDSDILFAARVSTMGELSVQQYSKVGNLEEKDKGLINYLMRDRHGSPFEHTSMTFFVSAPIFVFREFMRHRIASYNEESGRYRELRPIFYIPDDKRDLIQSGSPGSYTFSAGSVEQYLLLTKSIKESSTLAYQKYCDMLDAGIAREVARMVLPLNTYSSMYVTMNARALMNFLSLRTKNPAAKNPSYPQREIEMVAEKMEKIFAELMPITFLAFNYNGRVAP